MADCGKKATLLVTRSTEGTSTSIARRRVELCCRLPSGHRQPHFDPEQGERWTDEEAVTMILRHEEEEGSDRG